MAEFAGYAFLGLEEGAYFGGTHGVFVAVCPGLFGEGGADYLRGNAGADTLTGGAGTDDLDAGGDPGDVEIQ